jgi:glycine betaine/proline transport system ATP-binding protein
MIMQRRALMAGDDGHVWLDSGRRYRLSLNSSDQALGLHLDGVAHAFYHIQDDADLGRLEPGVAVAPASLSLQSIIHLRQTTGHPVLLAEQGRILGVCGEAEIIRALAGGRHTSAATP